MKSILWLASFCLLAHIAVAQTVSIAKVLNNKVDTIPYYDTTEFKSSQLAIRFPYGSARILNAHEYDSIRTLGKVAVEYVYTQYTHSQPSQRDLDRARFEALKHLAPDLFEAKDVHWRVVTQVAAQTAADAQRLFHGFVITYQPPVSKAYVEKVNRKLNTVVDCARKRPPADAPRYVGGLDSLRAYLSRALPVPAEVRKTGQGRTIKFSFRIDTVKGQAVRVWIKGTTDTAYFGSAKRVFGAMPRWSAGNPDVEFSLLIQYGVDKVAKKMTADCSPIFGYDVERCRGVSTDSTISKIMERNHNWKKVLVVEDVTGSMLPYVADLLLWNSLRSNLENTGLFVFFNDGDEKETEDKELGKAGGIYTCLPKSLTEVQQTMATAMAAGNGGDTPENNLEAILEGMKRCPECQDIILIADNGATPRDMELLEKIDRPIHVILCGVRNIPNPAYLKIAYRTKGTLHTIKQDIEDLAKLRDGETIDVLGVKFRILKGEFVELETD